MSGQSETRIRVAAVVGPTASGKTALSVALAKRLGAEIISCDSMQVYRRLDIGTAKPTAEEMQGIPHHLIDCVDPDVAFSAADYVAAAEEAVREITSRGRLPLFCGGTGLYLDAFLRGGFAETKTDPALRRELSDFLKREGRDALYARLVSCDPEAAAEIHKNNEKRVIRALEIYLSTGRTKSELDRMTREMPPKYDACIIGLDWSRELLYRRIDRRVDAMIEGGLCEETRRLLDEGVFDVSPTAAQAIGYKELFPYLRGECSLREAADALKTATRRYAKRQMTWFRAHGEVSWLSMDRVDESSGEICPRNFEEIVNNAQRVFRDSQFCAIIK